MTEVRTWLETLDLAQYADAFESNQVEFDLLTELTDDDLRYLGIASTGHRVRLRKAIGAIHGQASPTAERPTPEPVPAEPPSQPIVLSAGAERRQITAMFCDLAGSTALAEQLDPEDLRALMQDYQTTCGKVVGRYEGHIAQYLGDGLMIYFGWPRAHEDDAERAIRAGLELTAAVSGLTASAPLAVRIGIATGPVVVGDAGTDDLAAAKLAVGETPNLATHLHTRAEPNQIVIAPSTRRLAANAFDYTELTSDAGVSDGHLVVGLSHAEARFDASRAERLTPLVGRRAESELLWQRWRQSVQGEGQVVLISGEPGIGKSRLTETLRLRVAEAPHFCLRYQCSPYHTNSSLYPIVSQLEHAAGFMRGDTTEQKLDKLDAVLARNSAVVDEVAPLFAAMLSIPTGDRYPRVDLTAMRQKEKTIEALADQVILISRERPVLVIIEDVHWVDPSTYEALDILIERTRDTSSLVVITYRPEFIPPWTGRGHVSQFSLNRLSGRQVAEMVRNVAGDRSLPGPVMTRIAAHTDGIPLFIEEVTSSLLDSSAHGELTTAQLGLTVPIPETLQDSLMARLDRSPSAKETAQLAACIGREFSRDVLAAVSTQSDQALDLSLAELIDAELIFEHRSESDSDKTYIFKHALVQDTAYESLLKSHRQKFHARIARALRRIAPDLEASQPELLAHHYQRAGRPIPAIHFLLAAGEASLAKTALAEAIAHLTTARELSGEVPPSQRKNLFELRGRVVLGTALMADRGWPAPEVGEEFQRALELSELLVDRERLLVCLFSLFAFHNERAEFALASAFQRRLAEQAKDQPDSDFAMVSVRSGLSVAFWTGQFDEALDYLRSCRTHYDIKRHGKIAWRINTDPKSVVLAWGANLLWVMGWPDQARAAALEAVEHARALGHWFNLSFTLAVSPGVFIYLREKDPAEGLIQEALDIAREQSLPMIEAIGRITLGYCKIGRGEFREGLDSALSKTEFVQGSGMRAHRPTFCSFAAQGLAGLGKFPKALEQIDEGLDELERTGERFNEAELYRWRGEFLLAQSDPDPAGAEVAFEQALAVARRQNANGWELRGAMSLASLWRSQGKADEAEALLRPVYDWFTEGFETADLVDARALLDSLSSDLSD